MNICLISFFSDNLDEGVRNVAKTFYTELKHNHNVKKIDISSISDLFALRQFKPDIIHFVFSPTIYGLVLAKIVALLNNKSKIIISAVHPSISKCKLLKFLRIDLVLVQSKESENLFKSIGFPTKFLVNCVDIDKFKPINEQQKRKLRSKYQIDFEKYIILHLASLKRERNLEMLTEIIDEKNQVLIIGRENENIDSDLLEELKDKGCEVWLKHFPQIEEIYNLSDCYIFPSKNKNACIETPLSVLEAMACNLPVLTTKFGSLPDLFKQEKGLFFIEEPKDIRKILKNIKNGNTNNREKILPFAVETVLKELVNLYNEALNKFEP